MPSPHQEASDEYSKCSKILNTLFYTILVQILFFIHLFPKIPNGMANSVDLIRLLLQEQSDLGLHCLPMPFCQTLWCMKF